MLVKTFPTIASNKPKYTKSKDLKKPKKKNPFRGLNNGLSG